MRIMLLGIFPFLLSAMNGEANFPNENSTIEFTGITISNCPSNISVSATTPNGANVSWNPPTAITACVINSGTDCSSIPSSISGFIYMGQHNGSKYYCSQNSNHKWNNAKNIAEQNGGHLAVINNSAENNFLKNNILTAQAWIGYSDAASEGNFVWVGNNSSSYTKWSNGEPNNQGINGGSADHVILSSNGKWYDRNGNDKYEFVMETPCPSNQTLGTVNLTQTSGSASGSFFSLGTTTINYEAVDDCGNTQSCSFTITVTSADPCAGSGDNDGDGVCNNLDCFPWNPTIPAPIGSPCDDGDPSTSNDVIVGDECNCQGGGGGDPCASIGGDSDNDGVCDDLDCQPNNPNLPASPGTTCNDNDPTTSNDVIQSDGCTCEGITGGDPCAGSGDNDGDGVCNALDCFPWNPTLPAPIGSPCDDGDPNTNNDVVVGDECNCQGGGSGGTILPPDVHPKFVNNLPLPPRIDATNGGYYQLKMEESQQWLGLQDGNGNHINSTVWGFTYNNQKMHLGPTFITKKDVPINVKWKNNLPFTHLLPVDESIHKARPNYGVPTVVHLHGGHTEPESDGFPEAWFTQNFAETGPSFAKKTYHYTNDQEASNLWYHDHTLGMTRLNVYAGLAGEYLLRDDNELSLNLPSGSYERELIVQDKQFADDGSLYFPALLTDPEALDFPTNPNIEPTIFPEFFGDYIMVNGTVWPKLDVEATKYRFRVLNASDSRFYIFKLSNNATFQQIGTEGGLLNNPINLTQLVLAPGERADIVIDFSTMTGQSVTLQNFGPDEPFKGLAANQAAADPNTTGIIMRFNVQNYANAYFTIPYSLRQPIQYFGAATNTRQLLLLEGMDQYGRLKPSLGTAEEGQLGWVEPITETPVVNETEIWEVYNNTEDAHPVHIHQISFQLINRQEFIGDLDPNTSQLSDIQMVGAPLAPAPNEQGWKDTYIVPPGHVARFKVRFDIPGTFVWHCHILSHEDWDMMRPMEVLPAGGGGNDDCSSTTNLARNKSTAQSSTITAGGITGSSFKAVDGNTNGVYFTNPRSASSVSATNFENQAWWEVDLGATYQIENIKMFNRTDGVDKTGSCYLLISDTPFASDLTTARSQASYEHYEDDELGTPSNLNLNASGRYVRVQLVGSGYLILAEVEVNGCAPAQQLAVPNMLNFTAKKEGRQTEVSWLMNKDVEVEFYEIENSTDGINFNTLYEKMADQVDAPRNYTTMDTKPETGENFYRLRVNNTNGTFFYSNIRRVNFDIDFDEIILYPNPTNEFINVALRDFAGQKAIVEIYNTFGQLMYQKDYLSLPSAPMQISVNKFVGGIYTVAIKVENQRRFTKKFIVSKL